MSPLRPNEALKHPVDNPSRLGIAPHPALRHPSRPSRPHARLGTDHLYRRPTPALRSRNASGIETLSDLAQACPLSAQPSHDRSHVLSSHVLSSHKSHPRACPCLALSPFPPRSTSTYPGP